MRIDDKVDTWINTAHKRIHPTNPIRKGHSVVKLAKWTRENGFESLRTTKWNDGSDELAVPCPIVAIVDNKIREKNLELTITAKIAEELDETEYDQIETTITTQRYQPSDTITSTTWELPRFTRKNATFFLSGLGNKVYEITNITDNITELEQDEGGEIGFYALIGTGSKILYLLGLNKIQNMILEIINSLWLNPTVCPRCNGTGYINSGEDECPQCDTYGYSGYNATKNIQIQKGFDVGITRKKYTHPTTESQNSKIWKFVNKGWTQYWWVTPTISEIKRLFAHFYNVSTAEVYITERYHMQMPHWSVSVPAEATIGSPFGTGDTELMKYVARSVTPAGVNVFIGFYDIDFFAQFDDIAEGVVIDEGEYIYVSDYHYGKEWNLGSVRFFGYNGWNEALDNFEQEGTGIVGWDIGGTVDVHNVNDRFRHMARIVGDNSYMETGFTGVTNGNVEFWCHTESSSWRCSLLDSSVTGLWIGYCQEGTGFCNSSGIFRKMMPHNDAHIRLRFNCGTHKYSVWVNRELELTGIMFDSGVGSINKVRFENVSSGTGLFDCYGHDWASGYSQGDNWEDLYRWGWGVNHVDNMSGISGLWENYFMRDIPISF